MVPKQDGIACYVLQWRVIAFFAGNVMILAFTGNAIQAILRRAAAFCPLRRGIALSEWYLSARIIAAAAFYDSLLFPYRIRLFRLPRCIRSFQPWQYWQAVLFRPE